MNKINLKLSRQADSSSKNGGGKGIDVGGIDEMVRRKFLLVLEKLKQMYPESHCELNFSSPFELLIATILSAQCTDVRVNAVTKVLFVKYSSPFALARAEQSEIEEIVRPTGFFRNKAKNIIGCSKVIVEKYDGVVPSRMEQLLELPGVARKTANVVLWNAFGLNFGVVVDTHVRRLSLRLGWVEEVSVEKIELKLMELCPREDWGMLSHYLIFHGRKLCKARNPDCGSCLLGKGGIGDIGWKCPSVINRL